MEESSGVSRQRRAEDRDVLVGLLLNLGTLRNCLVCDCKIDRGGPPAPYTREDWPYWPYWDSHHSACELRVAAEAVGLPGAVAAEVPR